MKKQSIVFIIILIVVFALVGLGQVVIRQKANISLPTFKVRELLTPEITPETLFESSGSITISINLGGDNILSGNVEAKNAYEALDKLAEREGIEIKTKQYKYGLLVEKIGEKVNSKEAFWSYSVNGKAGNIASDRYVIYPEDKVEWRYEKIQN